MRGRCRQVNHRFSIDGRHVLKKNNYTDLFIIINNVNQVNPTEKPTKLVLIHGPGVQGPKRANAMLLDLT